jgi:O-acetyl-ADP-ribose deacetylase (regulator of RNase III)
MTTKVWDLLGLSKEGGVENETKTTNTVSIFDLTVWEDSLQIKTQELLTSNDDVKDQGTSQKPPIVAQENSKNDQIEEPSKFPYMPEINKKIVLWKGDITTIICDAIVNTTNESMTDTSGISGEILRKAGPELRTELSTTELCHTGEARMTKGYNLPARFVIHTVSPRYNSKYHTAAENALHSCYCSCLQMLKENNLRTIAFCVVNTTKRGYPPQDGVHIAIRTVRRFLEKFGSGIDRVAFVCKTDDEYTLYNETLPLYCPRSKSEERDAISKLPADTGNEFGETVIEERKIRISAFPTGPLSNLSDETTISDSDDLKLAPKLLTVMHGDQDETVKKRLEENSSKMEEAKRLQYAYFLQAQKTDFTDVSSRQIFYQSGTDERGRPIMIFVASRMPENENEMENVFLYIIKVMEETIAKNTEYYAIYIHTNTSGKSKPSFSWLKRLYNIMNDRYGKQLKTFYVLHPTFWLKLVETVVSSLFAANSEVFRKIVYIDRLADLYNVFDPTQLRFPNEVIQYDEKINGPIRRNNTNAQTIGEDL